MIEGITKSIVYYVTTKPSKENFFNQWRTNKDGTHWENLMGMSWEESDPPQSLIDEFREEYEKLFNS